MILSLQLFRLDRCLSPPAPRSLSPSRESLRELCSRSELAHFIYLTCIIAPEMNKKKAVSFAQTENAIALTSSF
jgi:hypothetical protein